MRAFPAGYALLIGVGQTVHHPWSLPVTVKDATALRSILADPTLCAFPDTTEHIRLLTDRVATAGAILGGLAWLRSATARDPEATAVVFYAGHGWLDRTTERYYLIHHATEPNDIPGTALSAEAFAAALRQVQARRLLAIFDCCHAQGMATARGEPTNDTPDLPRDIEVRPLPEPLAHGLKAGEGRAVLTSSRGTQRSWERPDGTHGIFTYHLLEALHGAGNLSGDDAVRLSNLMNHLSRMVPESARILCRAEQTPFFDQATEDFPIALLRGGRGLPSGGWAAVKHETRYDPPPAVQVDTMTGGNVQVGDRTVKQHGTSNLSAERISGSAIGENAKVVQGNDLSGADHRQGVNVSGGTIHGPVVGFNTGIVSTTYSDAARGAAGVSLTHVLAEVERAVAVARAAHDVDLVADLEAVTLTLHAAARAEREFKFERQAAKRSEAQHALRQLATAYPALLSLAELLGHVR